MTYTLNYLNSDHWVSKPESYSEGLGRHSKLFEDARGSISQEVAGWITEPELQEALNDLIRASAPAMQSVAALPPTIDFSTITKYFESLDKLKQLVSSEIVPLKEIRQKVNEKTSEVLIPLTKECARIEERFNRDIE